MHEDPGPLPIIDDLAPRVAQTTRAALDAKALVPIRTRFQRIDDSGVQFVLRIAENLLRKGQESRSSYSPLASGKKRSPFLPPEPELTVGLLPSGHIAVLNKFNVIENHLLIVTPVFEHQESLLTVNDFSAVAFCLRQVDGLVFYNGGREAGASQDHKHLQLVPLPISTHGPSLPVAPLLTAALTRAGVHSAPTLHFRHYVCSTSPAWRPEDSATAGNLRRLYRNLLDVAGIAIDDRSGIACQGASYNLLITRQWMLLVPRRIECFSSISVNALGFAGSLFVKNEDDAALIRDAGPFQVLRSVSFE